MNAAERTLEKDRRILAALASGKYTVTRDGRIFNNSHRNTGVKRELTYFKDGDGYTIVHLRGLKIVRLHRIVALAFLENPEQYLWVNHKNGIFSENRADNLEWGNPVETVEKAARLGQRHDQKGDGNNGARLSSSDVRKIRKLLNLKRMSQEEIADRFGVAQTTISAIARRILWGGKK